MEKDPKWYLMDYKILQANFQKKSLPCTKKENLM